jgi:two-component system, NtrC family, sensor histidine kinase GlrK
MTPLRLRIHYPRSFAALLLAGFVLVALPLLGGMIDTAWLLEKIVREERRSIATTVDVTRATRQLVDEVMALQRSAGQYFVLEDLTFRKGLDQAHAQFRETVEALRGLPLDGRQQSRLTSLASAEADLYGTVRHAPHPTADAFEALNPRFDGLHDAALAMGDEGSRLIDRQIAMMRNTVDEAWQTLIWEAVAMVPLSLGIALLFSWLINRPVQQLAEAIRRLGDNDLNPGPPVDGPRDLVYLGGQLDWLRKRLLELDEQKLRFLHHVSHELKTPLASLREGVELLSDRVGGELTGQQQEITHIMRGNARELQRRIEDLITYSRIVQQPEVLSMRNLALEDVWSSVLERQDLAIRSRRLTLEVSTGGLWVKGDRTRLETVFDNLLGNAVRFSPEGGRIRVEAMRDRDRGVVTIRDEGPGVPGPDRAHVFEPFYQANTQPPGPLRGSGLGLAIVREYVEAQGGQVSLVDDYGPGACFRVVLMASEEHTDAD